MSHVLSLIAAAAKTALTEADVAAARRALEGAAMDVGEPEWLSPGEAVEIPFAGDAGAALAAVQAALGGRPIDANVLPAANRRKRLLLADMDSTMIEQECLDEMAAAIGIGPAVAAITERAMRGEIAFEPALRERVALLRGVSTAVVGNVLRERIGVMPGATTLVATMRAHGAYTALVSGGFTAFAAPIAARIGFDEHHANTILAERGLYTGFVAEPILGRAGKERILRERAARLGLHDAATMAVGDGANDIAMIRRAGLGVAFRAKPLLRDAADAAIDHGDLTALLFLQGFRRDEFVAPAETASRRSARS